MYFKLNEDALLFDDDLFVSEPFTFRPNSLSSHLQTFTLMDYPRFFLCFFFPRFKKRGAIDIIYDVNS
jgi:hypothetical protein